jgi:hypothetical protein
MWQVVQFIERTKRAPEALHGWQLARAKIAIALCPCPLWRAKLASLGATYLFLSGKRSLRISHAARPNAIPPCNDIPDNASLLQWFTLFVEFSRRS